MSTSEMPEVMAAIPTRIETEDGRRLSPEEIFEVTRAREIRLSRLLIAYISAGLVFMLLPGTFLGVWNLLAISSHRAANSVSSGWIQAHGHAQIFGWIGSFILGIGFYSIPKLRRAAPFALWTGWLCWTLWTSGVLLHWFTGVYEWHWRVLLPFSAALELLAFLIFFRGVSQHRRADGSTGAPWIVAVIAGSIGLLLTLLMTLAAGIYLASQGMSPDLPHGFDQRFLVLQTWGFLVPFVWGFSAKWLPIFLGLRSVRGKGLLVAVGLNGAGVLAALVGWIFFAVLLLACAITVAVYALRLFEPVNQMPKVKGVHSSFPVFIRVAYVWAAVAAGLAIWAASLDSAAGIWGASRHALTVGFLATMVFSIGQRVLPAFSGMRLLFSTKLMFISLVLLTAGCLLRVSSEVLAYQGFVESAWSWLPISAITEMTAVSLFAFNLLATFQTRPRPAAAQGIA